MYPDMRKKLFVKLGQILDTLELMIGTPKLKIYRKKCIEINNDPKMTDKEKSEEIEKHKHKFYKKNEPSGGSSKYSGFNHDGEGHACHCVWIF